MHTLLSSFANSSKEAVEIAREFKHHLHILKNFRNNDTSLLILLTIAKNYLAKSGIIENITNT